MPAAQSGNTWTVPSSAGLSWPLTPDLDDGPLKPSCFPSAPTAAPEKRGLPEMEYIRKELTRKGVTLYLLWLEYRAANPDGYQYSQFCLLYRQWTGKLDVCLRQTHRAGEKLFVDYAGQTIPVTDPVSGQVQRGLSFYRRLGRQQLHLCLGLFLAGPSFLGRCPCPGV